MKSQKPLSRKDNIVIQEMDGEVLIYDLAKDRAFCLNETSALVWQACDGNRTVSEINTFINKKLSSPANEDLVWMALDQLKKEELIEKKTLKTSPFEGMGRREVIRKVGLSTLLALPVIASLTSPTSAQTASTCVPLGSCDCTMDSFMMVVTTCGSQTCMTNTTSCTCANVTCSPNPLVAGEFVCGMGMCAVP
jgi:hypothetical protein